MNVFLLISFLLNMTNPCECIEINDLIGVKIGKTKCRYQPKKLEGFENNYYSINGEDRKFIGKPFIQLLLITDSDDDINKILTSFRGIIDDSYFSTLKSKFGEPNKILRKNIEREIEKESYNGTDATRIVSTLIECKFHERPDYLIWNYEGCEITLNIQYESDKTEVLIEKL